MIRSKKFARNYNKILFQSQKYRFKQLTEAKKQEAKKQVIRIFTDEKLAVKVFMDCRTTSTHKFRARLEFQQYDEILTKEQPVLTRVMSSFEGNNI